MKDTKQRSFDWLKNLDASVIVDIDVDLPVPEQIPKPTPSKLRDQIEEIHSKLQKSVPKTLQKAPLSISSIEELPEFYSIFKDITVTSPTSFDWIKQIEPLQEAQGIIEASQNISSNVPSRSIFSAVTYWTFESSVNDEWLPSLQSIYLMFASGICPYFYVSFKKFFCLFLRESNKSVVYLPNTNAGLISNLRKNLVNIPQEDPEIENIFKVKNKKNELVRIEGKSVHAFYNYLVNSPGDCRIYSRQVFLNGQFKMFTTRVNEEFTNHYEKPHIQYRLGFTGPILRENIVRLCKVFQSVHSKFTIELGVETGTNMMPGSCPTKIARNENGSYDVFIE